MVRRSTPQKTIDDRAFPVRLKIVAPRFGIGLDYMGMMAWLDREIGVGAYAHHGGGRTGDCHVLAFYFRRPEQAVAFLQAYPVLELADGTCLPSYSSPYLRYHRAAERRKDDTERGKAESS